MKLVALTCIGLQVTWLMRTIVQTKIHVSDLQKSFSSSKLLTLAFIGCEWWPLGKVDDDMQEHFLVCVKFFRKQSCVW